MPWTNDQMYAMVNKPEPEEICRYDLINKPDPEELMHFGIKGQKWGIRRYQNEDGSYTEAGKKRYNRILSKVDKHPELLNKYYDEIKPDDRKKILDKQKDLSTMRGYVKNKREEKGPISRATKAVLTATASYAALYTFAHSPAGQAAGKFVKDTVQKVKWNLHGDEITDWVNKGRQQTQLLLEMKDRKLWG